MRASNRTSRPAVPRLTNVWREALALHEASWLLGDEGQKDQYRGSGNNDALAGVLRKYLRDDLIDRLSRGELLALGVQVTPQAGHGPATIPSFMFHHSEVDWDRSAVTGYGRRYEGVSVARPEDALRIRRSKTKRQVRPPASRPTTDAPKRLGRPPVTDKIREAVRVLRENGQLDRMLRKEQVDRVRAEAQQRDPMLFPPPRPSRTKILQALKAEGF